MFNCEFCDLPTPDSGEYLYDGEKVCVSCFMWLEDHEEEIVDYPEDFNV
jgi:hypothetical protein